MSKNFEIRKEVVLEATPEQVWHAIATPEGQAAWSPDPYVSTEGMDLEEQENVRLAIRTPEAENGAFQAFEYLIEGQDDGTTVLRFVHSGFLGEDWDTDFDYGEMTGWGWNMYLHTLAEYFRHFSGRPAVFVTAQGPEGSSTPEAWRTLERDLGLEGPVTTGQQVRLTPTGLPELDGVVDFSYDWPGTNFIALRTADGLYRFHDMSPMGMRVAVGHYIYADIDREVTQQAWQDWLARIHA
jgi:uncharacterized protein YndB with AHSA1/START domain